jgi:hypothetical protein
MRSVRVALVAGLALTAVAIGVTLTGSPTTLISTNRVPINALLADGNNPSESKKVCQANEVLPQGTSAIRTWVEDIVGPKVTVEALSGTRILTSGTRPPGWIGGTVTVPVTPVRRTTSHVEVCFTLNPTYENTSMFGDSAPPAIRAIAGGQSLPGRLRIEYLKPDRRSWSSLALPVVRRMGLGRAPSGIAVVLLIAAFMTAMLILVSRVILRELR